jgi:hypothetical protein
VGLNVSNEQPSTCISALLREEQRRSNPELPSTLVVSPEVSAGAVLMIHTCTFRHSFA